MRSNQRVSAKKSVSQAEFDRKLDDLEGRLRSKVEVLSGFADPEVKARKLEQSFRYFDTNGSGSIDFNEFFAAMTKMNFVGVQSEIEGLFNRYDEDASGEIDYKEFSYGIYGIGDRPKPDVNSRNIVEKVKARIVERGGASGIHAVTKLLKSMDTDGSKNIDRNELMQGLRAYGINNVSPSEMQILFNHFDRDGSGRITTDEFLLGLKSGMSFERKQLVKRAFNLLDRTGDGFVKVEDILQSYNYSSHPNVIAGRMSPEQAAEEMLECFERGGNIDGTVTWAEFLDYYKGISLSIDDDNYFELMMRNAWHMSGGEGAAANSTCKRVLVVHSDGVEEVVEIKNDLGLDVRNRDDIIRRLRQQGVQDIYNVKV
jgi:Ca2+-binding EF-hand superfamily protein